jgi:hypothetical protein
MAPNDYSDDEVEDEEEDVEEEEEEETVTKKKRMAKKWKVRSKMRQFRITIRERH